MSSAKLLSDGDQAGQKKVAIIGAGWAGLQTMHCLQKMGFKVELYDKFSKVGGTWSPHLSYHSLTIHSPRWLNTMYSNGQKVPWKQNDQEFLDAKADAGEMHQCMVSFATSNGLMPNIHLNSLIEEVRYDSKSKKATLLVSEGGRKAVETSPFDIVVFSSVAGSPSMPDIPNKSFSGQVVHSSELTEEFMKNIIAKNLQVAIIGGGKSSADMVVAFQKASYNNVVWLQRNPYWFFRYEAIGHDRSLMAKLRGFLFVLCWLLSVPCGKLGIFCAWMLGHICMPSCDGFPKHFDACRFNFGTLCKEQRHWIAQVKKIFGTPTHFDQGGVALKSGELVPCDVVICATGYETGFGNIKCVKDGKPIDLQNKPLFHHAVVPQFPCLLLAPMAFYHFGPLRGVTLAQYISYYANAEGLTEEDMEKSAQANWCVQYTNKFFAFDNKVSTQRSWFLMFLDLVKNGLLSIPELIKLPITSFVLGVYEPMVLRKGAKA